MKKPIVIMKSAVFVGLGIALVHAAVVLAQPPDDPAQAKGKGVPGTAASKPAKKPAKAASPKSATTPTKHPVGNTPGSLSQDPSRQGANFSLSGPYFGLKYKGNE